MRKTMDQTQMMSKGVERFWSSKCEPHPLTPGDVNMQTWISVKTEEFIDALFVRCAACRVQLQDGCALRAKRTRSPRRISMTTPRLQRDFSWNITAKYFLAERQSLSLLKVGKAKRQPAWCYLSCIPLWIQTNGTLGFKRLSGDWIKSFSRVDVWLRLRVWADPEFELIQAKLISDSNPKFITSKI